ncbi:MAG: glutamate-1-semialdehyde 2,1-aminomutase [Verrucomicrobiota bacterium]|nr:glutamate-1-semialdehyde 2,1-aminomutase [Verrucomicrobiota bacterium]
MRPFSTAIYERASLAIPGGVNSPVRAAKGLLPVPLIVEKGKGAKVWDVDGHSYIDYCMSWGALILGHADPGICSLVSQRMEQGSSFGIATRGEVELAEEIQKRVPSMEKVRLVSSGTEATMTALRLARAYTGRSKFVKFIGHYHGHADPFLVRAGSGASFATSRGVPNATVQETIALPFNDFSVLRSLFASPVASEIAAVILEPVAANMGVVPPHPDLLQFLREETKRIGALLIFDEVITGFRLSLQGAQGVFQIDPDLTCLGKIIGGGFPLAAVGGKREILDLLSPLGDVYQAGTLSGNPVAVAAGLATLKAIALPGFYEELERKSKRLALPIQEAIDRYKLPATLQRVGSLLTLFLGQKEVRSEEEAKACDFPLFARLFQRLFSRGIYIPPSPNEAWFVSAAHSDEEIDRTVAEVVDFLML